MNRVSKAIPFLWQRTFLLSRYKMYILCYTHTHIHITSVYVWPMHFKRSHYVADLTITVPAIMTFCSYSVFFFPLNIFWQFSNGNENQLEIYKMEVLEHKTSLQTFLISGLILGRNIFVSLIECQGAGNGQQQKISTIKLMK